MTPQFSPFHMAQRGAKKSPRPKPRAQYLTPGREEITSRRMPVQRRVKWGQALWSIAAPCCELATEKNHRANKVQRAHESCGALMPISQELIDRVFSKLVMTYGTRFMSQYPEPLRPADVKRHWSEELDGLSRASIEHALQNLPSDFPPNTQQFRTLCNRRVEPVKHEPPPPANPAVVAKARAKLGELASTMRDPMANVIRNAKALQAREQRGEQLTRPQREFWRAALRVPPEEQGQ